MNKIRVVKIGGSLLQRDNLLADLRAWQESQIDPLVNVWIVGGGAAVEAIRKRDSHHGMSDDDAHWSSIEVMDTNAMVLASRLPDWQLISSEDFIIIAASNSNGDLTSQNFILQTKHWLTQADRDPDARPGLPHSWDVTSDSIAAWAAIQLHATELVLLKSCDVPDKPVAELAGLGIVDAHLPNLNLHRQTFRFICQQLPHSTT